MALSLKFYTDAALASPFPGPLNIGQAVDGTTGPVDTRLYIGSTELARKFEAVSNPGVDDILLSVEDLNIPSGQPVTAVKLAFTQAGLDTAVAGDPLNLGPQLLSEPINAVEVWVRVEDQVGVVGNYSDLYLDTNALVENAV